MLESSIYQFGKHDMNIMKTGIKQGKTAEEVVSEYQPWTGLITAIQTSLAAENSVAKQPAEEAAPVSQMEPNITVNEVETVKLKTSLEEGPDLACMEEDWLSMVDRIISKHCAFVTGVALLMLFSWFS